MDTSGRTGLDEYVDSAMAAGVAALAGVSEIAAALRPVIGDAEVDRIVRVMVERLSQFQTIDGFQEMVRREIANRSGRP